MTKTSRWLKIYLYNIFIEEQIFKMRFEKTKISSIFLVRDSIVSSVELKSLDF